MKLLTKFLFIGFILTLSGCGYDPSGIHDPDLTEFVNPLIGTDPAFSQSNGDTYPAIARPWINDYAALTLMAVTGDLEFTRENRASWFSQKAETVKPRYYSVYLTDYDIKLRSDQLKGQQPLIIPFLIPCHVR